MTARRRASAGDIPARTLSSACNCRWLSISAERSRSDRVEPNTPSTRTNHARKDFMVRSSLPTLDASASILVGRQEASHDRARGFPLARVALDLFLPSLGQLVELCLAVVVGDAPLG